MALDFNKLASEKAFPAMNAQESEVYIAGVKALGNQNPAPIFKKYETARRAHYLNVINSFVSKTEADMSPDEKNQYQGAIQGLGIEDWLAACRDGDVDRLNGLKAKALHPTSGLDLACTFGRINVVQFLLQNGAHPNTNPLALDQAVAHGHLELVQLLLEKGADINLNSNGTALHTAARVDRVDLVRMLLQRGADRDLKDSHNETASDVASGMVQQLLLNDVRLGHLVFDYHGVADPKTLGPHVVLIGFPNDMGVGRNGGRLGAAGGPESFRRHMKNRGVAYNPEYNIDLTLLKIYDFGDVGTAGELEDRHLLLTAAVRKVIENGGTPVVIGGGHDMGYPDACGLMAVKEDIGCINIDAHLDVRPLKHGKVHSGSSFYQLLLDPRFDGKKFVEFGAQGNVCAKVHADFVLQHGGAIKWLSQLRKVNLVESYVASLATLGNNIYVTFDVDAVNGADAPGVSAPGTVGLTAQEALDISFESGLNRAVKLFDMPEFNPAVEDFRTGRLVVDMFYYFLMGFSKRQQA